MNFIQESHNSKIGYQTNLITSGAQRISKAAQAIKSMQSNNFAFLYSRTLAHYFNPRQRRKRQAQHALSDTHILASS
jgi:hypothetical protein